MMSTYLPTVFGENLMDAFDDFDLFRGFGNVDRALYGKHAQNVMKTDVKETDDGYEVDVDLPGFKMCIRDSYRQGADHRGKGRGRGAG